MPDVSIVIVSFNARADLLRCLVSLRDAPPARSHEIIVVDNASTDGSADAAKAFANVQVIEAGRNTGFAGGNNIGIRASRGTNVLLLNSDTVVPPGAVDALLSALDQHPDVAVVGPRLVDGNGHAELSFGRRVGLREHLERKLRSMGDVDAFTRRERYPDWITGACLLVRRHDADAVGLLDERYFMYLEDVDFCLAIGARGRRILFTPSVDVTHLRGRSSASEAAASALHRRSLIAFYNKHRPFLAPLVRLFLSLHRGDE